MATQNEKPATAKVASVTRIPGYKIKGLLGRGGMAVVYLAEQESIGREVALKVLAPDHTDETFSQRFLAEARIISQLSHPNIVTVYDAGVHQGNHYMAMEYVKGQTLGDARDTMSLAQRIDVIRQIADALDYAGGKGYVHRDIKPDNIMRHEDGRAVLMDFGIARNLDTTKGLTVTGKAIGTPYYMSPEQTKGLKVDPRSDIYSLGVVLFQMLAGRVPYDGPSFVAVGIKHISEPIPLLPPGLEAFQQIINNSMSKEAAHRYQTAGEMKAALDALPEALLQKPPAKQPAASSQVHHARTVLDTAAQPAATKASASQGMPVSHSVAQSAPNFRSDHKRQELPPIDITASADFKRLRRRRRLLYLLLLSCIAYAGYHRQDIWLPTWQYEIAPWLAANVPQSKAILKYLPAAKEKPKVVAIRPAQAPRVAPGNRPLPVAAPAPTETPITSPLAEENATPPLPNNVAMVERQNPEPVILTPEEEQREKIKALKAGLNEHSENALKLAILYKSILVHERENTQAQQGLAELRQWLAKEIRAAINSQEWERSRLLLNMVKESFPAAMQEEQFRYMELNTESAEKLQSYLQKAEHYLQKRSLNHPAGANALEEFNKALLLAPENTEAKTGIHKIADHFYQLARQQQKAKDIQAAINSTQTGLAAESGHKGLLALQDELQYSMKHQQNIRGLLENAGSQAASGNLITPRGKSAYDLYRVVLAESPANPAAIKGLEKIERVLVQQIQQLMKQGQYPQAQQQLQLAQQYFRNSRALDFLQRKLTTETYREPTTSN